MEQWKKILPLKRGAFFTNPPQRFASRLPVKKSKYQDLLKLAKTHLPPDYQIFYTSIPYSESVEVDDDLEL